MTTNPEKETSDNKEWNEDALAELVGLENQSRANTPESSQISDSLNAINQADLFDAPREEPNDPHKNTTTRSLAKKPLPKLALVAVGLLVVFGIGGLALSSMMGVKVASKAPKVQPSAKTSIVDKKASIESKEGELKTQLAISKQADELKAIDENSKDKKKEKVKPDKDKKNTTSATALSPKTTNTYSPPPAPAPVAYVPPPVRTPAPAPIQSPPRLEASPPRLESSPKPVPIPSPTGANNPLHQQPIKQQDPLEQWNKLARLGSYGIVGESDAQEKEAGEQKAGSQGERGWTAGSREPARENFRSTLSHTSEPQYPPDSKQLDTEAENRILQGIPIRRLVPGATAAAQLATSLVWSTDVKDETRFVVALKEPLISVDGNHALATGQQIVFHVSGISSNGLVTATAVSTIDDQGIERALPANVLTLQADREKPLVAKGLFDPGTEIAGMDFGIAALGAVSKVGEILNRPKQQSSSSSTGSETSTTTTSVSGSPNLLGALMEGGATPVLESIQKRNQTAIETLSKQKNAWFLPAGESAQIVVSQLFEL
jgi:hypothetical protein